jgi:hypothetical protein
MRRHGFYAGDWMRGELLAHPRIAPPTFGQVLAGACNLIFVSAHCFGPF